MALYHHPMFAAQLSSALAMQAQHAAAATNLRTHVMQ
jgi:hypothetical protein